MARLKRTHLAIGIGTALVCIACVSLPDLVTPNAITIVTPPIDSNKLLLGQPDAHQRRHDGHADPDADPNA